MTTEETEQVPSFEQLRHQITALRERAERVSEALNGVDPGACGGLVAQLQASSQSAIESMGSCDKKLRDYESAAKTARQEHLNDVLLGMFRSLQYGEQERMAYLESGLARWQAER